MLSSSGLSRDFWAKAAYTACYIINRSPASALNMKTPEEMWTGRPADYSVLRVFGCPAYAHVRESKLDSRAKKCIFLGYASGVKGYRLWCTEPGSQGFLVSRDVTFHETVNPSRELLPSSSQGDQDKNQQDRIVVEIDQNNRSQQQPTQITQSEQQQQIGSEIQTQEEATTQSQDQSDSIAIRRPRRQIRPPQRFDDFACAELVYYALSVADTIGDEPTTYQEAISSLEAEQWTTAIMEELQSLEKNQT